MEGRSHGERQRGKAPNGEIEVGAIMEREKKRNKIRGIIIGEGVEL